MENAARGARPGKRIGHTREPREWRKTIGLDFFRLSRGYSIIVSSYAIAVWRYTIIFINETFVWASARTRGVGI